MKRLYDSSLGRLELELDADFVVSISLFDDEGRVARETEDEWEHTDVPDLLRVEIGLPEAEAQEIATSFLEAAEREDERPEGAGRAGDAVALVILAAVLAALGVGVWTIATSITREALVVGLLVLVLWLLPAILILRWRDRRRARRRNGTAPRS